MLKNRFTLALVILLLLPTLVLAQQSSWSNVLTFQTKMANAGNASAQLILGEMYEEGRGVQKNYTTAFKWYRKAEKTGHKKAAQRIINLENKITSERLAKEKAAEQLRKKKLKKIQEASSVKQIKPVKIKQSPKSSLSKKTPAKSKKTKLSEAAPLKPNKTAPLPLTKKTKTAPKKSFTRIQDTHLDSYEDPFE